MYTIICICDIWLHKSPYGAFQLGSSASNLSASRSSSSMANHRDDPGYVKLPEHLTNVNSFFYNCHSQPKPNSTCPTYIRHAPTVNHIPTFQHSNLLHQAHRIPTFQWRDRSATLNIEPSICTTQPPTMITNHLSRVSTGSSSSGGASAAKVPHIWRTT